MGGGTIDFLSIQNKAKIKTRQKKPTKSATCGEIQKLRKSTDFYVNQPI